MFSEVIMEIDFYAGGENCLIIFTGLNGNTKGYGDKYLKIAEAVVKDTGFSVFVAAVPGNCWDCPQEVFTSAVDYALSKVKAENIYITGNSAGANLAICYSYLYPQIKKVLAINPVLNLNYHKTKEGILNFNSEKMFVVTGELDPAAVWLNSLPSKSNLSTEILQGVDHVFTDNLEKFIALPQVLFKP